MTQDRAEFDELLADYWDIAAAEEREGRTHDLHGSAQKTLSRLRELFNSAKASEAGRLMKSPDPKLAGQADAWMAVARLLDKLRPGWILQEGKTAEESALDTIKSLAESSAQQAEAVDNDQRRLPDLGNELHNLSCEVHHTNQRWADEIQCIAIELWNWPAPAPVVPTRDEVLQCLLATSGQSEGVAADAILDLMRSAAQSARERACEWIDPGGELWSTGCGEAIEDKCKIGDYCPHCGDIIVERES